MMQEWVSAKCVWINVDAVINLLAGCINSPEGLLGTPFRLTREALCSRLVNESASMGEHRRGSTAGGAP